MSEILDKEYNQIAKRISHYENMKLSFLSIFVALMIAMMFLAIGSKVADYTLWPIRIGALFIVLLFWLQDLRLVGYWKALRDRSLEIETDLGIRVFSVTPRKHIVSGSALISLLYMLFFIFWLVQLLLPSYA
jgi:cation transport ATPase